MINHTLHTLHVTLFLNMLHTDYIMIMIASTATI